MRMVLRMSEPFSSCEIRKSRTVKKTNAIRLYFWYPKKNGGLSKLSAKNVLISTLPHQMLIYLNRLSIS